MKALLRGVFATDELKTCDRCGKEFLYCSGLQVQENSYTIYGYSRGIGPIEYELCSDCQKELHKWIHLEERL